VTIKGGTVAVKGPKGELSRELPRDITASLDNGVLTVVRPSDQEHHKALHGLSRTLVANMVEGVSKGFERVLEIQGVGYKAEVVATGLKLSLGFSHQVVYAAPSSIKVAVENNTVVRITGPSKELVGQVASEIRAIRPPEPYKGKGVRYQGERVRRTDGKTEAK